MAPKEKTKKSISCVMMKGKILQLLSYGSEFMLKKIGPPLFFR